MRAERVSTSTVNIASVKMVQESVISNIPSRGRWFRSNNRPEWVYSYNNHVIDDAKRLKVTLTDGRMLNGKVIGKDEITDLAVVKAEGISTDESDVLPYAHLGNSDDLKIGQVVIAIGNPFGLTGGPTVTAGIISSLNRNLQFENGMLELIQTDAAINPGNSGGPLVNTKGEVIAINTAKMPYAHGIGFAVPINIAKSIMNELIQNGRVSD